MPELRSIVDYTSFMIRRFFETLGGLSQLARLAAATGFQMRGSYWSWREETAFGSDPANRPPKSQQRQAIMDYARWVHRMRRVSP
jgi:hypothetical protein